MGDYRIIAAVTATTCDLLKAVLHDVPSASITFAPPDVGAREGGKSGLNIFLYQVTVNANYANLEQPIRIHDGIRVRSPLALDLRYILTAYAGDNDLLAQEILGSAMRTIHDHPVITRDDICKAITSSSLPSSLKFDDPDLIGPAETVSIIPLQLSIEEMMNLWLTFHTNYRLSTAYEMKVVLIDNVPDGLPAESHLPPENTE